MPEELLKGLSAEGRRSVTIWMEGKAAARLEMEQAVRKSRTNATDWFYFGVMLHQADNLSEADKAFAQAAQLKPDAAFWHERGVAFTLLCYVGIARPAFELGVRISPRHAPSLAAMAWLAMLAGNASQAESWAKKAAGIDPGNVRAQYILSTLLFRKGKTDEALGIIESALKHQPDSAPALLLKHQLLLGKSFRSRDDKEESVTLRESIAVLERWLQLDHNADEISFLADPDFMWQEQLQTLKAMESTSAQNQNPVPASEVANTNNAESKKPRLVSFAKAKYTEAARQAHVQGEVIISIVITSEGNVSRIIVLQALSHGLTDKALEAARKCRFSPGMKDGKPVNVRMNMAFAFNVY